MRRGFSPWGFDNKRLTQAKRCSACLIATLFAELVEFSVSCAAEKCMPFTRREPEDRAGGVFGIADTDPAIREAGDLDAVAVGETQRTLGPGQTCARQPFRAVFVH